MNIRYALSFFFISFFFFISTLKVEGKDFVVVIDAGHGGKDPGAKGAVAKEKAINLAVALKLGRLISASHSDVKVVYTRKTDVFIGLNERANIANKNKADLFISIHANSAKATTVRGAETYTLGLAKTQENLEVAMQENSAILLEENYLQRYEGFDPKSSESYIIFDFIQNRHMEQSVSFASEVQKALSQKKRANRGVRQAGFLVLKATSMASALIELGFISNKTEEKYMNSAAGQKELAQAIYNAFCVYKKNCDRKRGGQRTTAKSSTSKPSANKLKMSSLADNPGYVVQIMATKKKIPKNSPHLKGYEVSCFYDGEYYKYVYGKSMDIKEARQTKRTIEKDFKNAFVVELKEGQYLN